MALTTENESAHVFRAVGTWSMALTCVSITTQFVTPPDTLPTESVQPTGSRPMASPAVWNW